jgi:hypothetical protein
VEPKYVRIEILTDTLSNKILLNHIIHSVAKTFLILLCDADRALAINAAFIVLSRFSRKHTSRQIDIGKTSLVCDFLNISILK